MVATNLQRKAKSVERSAWKWCKKCGMSKPLSEFHHDAKKPDGHDRLCKICKREEIRDYRKRKKDGGGHAFPKPKCVHYRICGDDLVRQRFPNFLDTHDPSPPDWEWQVCQVCGDAIQVEQRIASTFNKNGPLTISGTQREASGVVDADDDDDAERFLERFDYERRDPKMVTTATEVRPERQEIEIVVDRGESPRSAMDTLFDDQVAQLERIEQLSNDNATLAEQLKELEHKLEMANMKIENVTLRFWNEQLKRQLQEATWSGTVAGAALQG